MAFDINAMIADIVQKAFSPEKLKKIIPPEIMDKLTPENFKDIGDKANAFITDIREQMTRIEDQNVAILARLNEVDKNLYERMAVDSGDIKITIIRHIEHLGRVINDNGSGDGTGNDNPTGNTRQRKRGSNSASVGSDG